MILEMIHIGKRSTLTTLCGKPVARRWWVEVAHMEFGTIGKFVVGRWVMPDGATCKHCLAATHSAPPYTAPHP